MFTARIDTFDAICAPAVYDNMYTHSFDYKEDINNQDNHPHAEQTSLLACFAPQQ